MKKKKRKIINNTDKFCNRLIFVQIQKFLQITGKDQQFEEKNYLIICKPNYYSVKINILIIIFRVRQSVKKFKCV